MMMSQYPLPHALKRHSLLSGGDRCDFSTGFEIEGMGADDRHEIKGRTTPLPLHKLLTPKEDEVENSS